MSRTIRGGLRPKLCLAPFVLLATGCTILPSPSTPAGDAAATNWALAAAQRLPPLVPCELPNAPEDVLCGTVDVLEDRSSPHGRQISLNVVVVPAQRHDPPDDAIFIFEGGPGGAATGRAVGSVFAGPVRQRDIVLVDQRGTGRSNPLDCDVRAGAPPGQLRELFPSEAVARCAAELATRADLTFYSTEHFADDIEDVRRTLGYGRINVRGGSYGTASMMVFAQRYPQSVRSLFGVGVDSPRRTNLSERGRWSDRTLRRLGDVCSRDPACATIAPDLFAMTEAVLDEVPLLELRVELPDPFHAGRIASLALDRGWLAEQLRLILYFSFSSRGLPWAIHRAHDEDDLAPLVTMALLIEHMFKSNLATGVLLTVQCSEGMHFDAELALSESGQTLVGSYRLEQQLQGCAAWPHERRPPLGVASPRTLAVPTLLLSGALDPVTPPEYGNEVQELFPNSHHVVLDEGQHGPFDLTNSWECFHQVWADFLDVAEGLEDGDFHLLDTSCTEEMTRQPFAVGGQAFEAYLAETLRPAAGLPSEP